MRNSADFVKDIITDPEVNAIIPSDKFSPYLVQRYISGVSPAHCNLLNTVLNSKLTTWRDEQEIYDFLKILIPKSKTVQYQYFGKTGEGFETKVDLDNLSKILEMPKKEIVEMLKCFPKLENNLIEDKEKILKVKSKEVK